MTVHQRIISELNRFFRESNPKHMTPEQKALNLISRWKTARQVLKEVHPRSVEAAAAEAEIRAIERQVDKFQTETDK